MMCPDCGEAGRLLASATDYRDHGQFTDADSLTRMAKEKHEKCPSFRSGNPSHCTCQHELVSTKPVTKRNR